MACPHAILPAMFTRLFLAPHSRNRRLALPLRIFALSSSHLNLLREYDATLRATGATGVYIFGSRARGTERSDSDLDLFIDYDPAVRIPSLFRLMQIEEEISRGLGVPVTITTRNALHPLMKDAIERDAIRVL